MTLLNNAIDQLVSLNKKLVKETKERSTLQKELEEYRTSLEKLVQQKTVDLNSASQLLYKAIDDASIGIVSVDLKGHFLKVNKRFCDLLGYSSAELMKLNFQDITLPEDRPIGSNRIKDMLAGKIDKAEFDKRYVHKNGDNVHAQLNTVLLRNDQYEPLYFFTQVQDISQQKQAEIELKKQQAEQEQIITERTSRYLDSQKALSYLLEDVNEMRDELEYTNDKLQDVNKELESFTYSVSHDLRAPLRAIDGFAQILCEDNWNELDDAARENIEIIKKNVYIMNTLINDLLEYSRLERKTVRITSLNTNKLIAAIIADNIFEIDKEKTELIIEDLPDMKADPILIKQVWINLLSNALKYSSRQKKAVIKIGSLVESEAVTYFIQDNGVGFNMQYKDKLFGVFQRLHTSEEFEGTGVGLAIVNKIISKHQGEIWVDAAPGKGATFYFRIP